MLKVDTDADLADKSSMSAIKKVTFYTRKLNRKSYFFRKNAFGTNEIRSFGLKEKIVDFRLSYTALNPLAACDGRCR